MMSKNKNFKVVMFGESNSCKTSVLTQILCNKTLKSVANDNNISLGFETIEEKEFIKSSDTIMSNFFEADIPIPNAARSKPRHLFSQFPLFTYPTKNDRTFSLSVKDSSTKNTLQKIEFYDYSGLLTHALTPSKTEKREYFELVNKIKESNVILFTVDSVSLMERDYYPKESVQFLLNILNSQEERGNQDEKMILIVPTKFEKYYHKIQKAFTRNENDFSTLHEITSNIRTGLAPLLDWLGDPLRRCRYEVSILPILTLGNIDFFAYLSSNGTDITLDPSGQQYFQYYYNTSLNLNQEFNVNILPCYDPKFGEYHLSMIIAYMLDRILSSKCRRLSACPSFKSQPLSDMKDNLTSFLTAKQINYPHSVIQSKFIND